MNFMGGEMTKIIDIAAGDGAADFFEGSRLATALLGDVIGEISGAQAIRFRLGDAGNNRHFFPVD